MKSPNVLRSGNHRWWRFAALSLIWFVGWSDEVRAESQQEILFFTSIDTFKNISGDVPNIDDSYIQPAVDVLYSYSGEKFRFLAEYFWSNRENDLERLKAGWQTGDNTMLWFGRFHSPAKYWTTEYHHGQFLQTSITRPSIEEWEDDSGPMASHITGLSLAHESIRPNNTAINYSFSVGLAPQLDGQVLAPFDLLDPGSGNDVAFNYRMAYRPDVLSLNQFGLMAAWNEINVLSESNPELADLDHIRQITVGLYVDWNWDKWRLLSSFVYFNNDMQYIDAPEKDEFISGYVQAEYRAAKDWTIFGRTENSFNEDKSQYLRILPAFISQRNMIGVRWDFASFQGLTVEIADTRAQGDDFTHINFGEVRIQWSAVFP